MSRMFLKKAFSPCRNQRGIGLITAIFVIIIVGMFGVLIARYATVSSVTSSEDYFWAQALYSAQSAAQIAILYDDGGGSGSESLTSVGGVAVSTSDIVDGVEATAIKNIGNRPIQRTIEIHLSL